MCLSSKNVFTGFAQWTEMSISRNDFIIPKHPFNLTGSENCQNVNINLRSYWKGIGNHLQSPKANGLYIQKHSLISKLTQSQIGKTKNAMSQKKATRLCLTGWKSYSLINCESSLNNLMQEVLSGAVLTVWDWWKMRMTAWWKRTNVHSHWQ